MAIRIGNKALQALTYILNAEGIEIERLQKEYDSNKALPTDYLFSYTGRYGAQSRMPGVVVSGFLPLAIIRACEWTRLAELSDYPEMVKMGDWSGIRDSSRETVMLKLLPVALKILNIA